MTQVPVVSIVDTTNSMYIANIDVESSVLDGYAQVRRVCFSNQEELLNTVFSDDVIIVWHSVSLPSSFISKLKACRAIIRPGVGYDNIDVEEANTNGIPVINIPDYGSEEVADHAIMLILALQRKLLPSLRQTCRGNFDWRIVGNLARLRGKILGLVGLGRIGIAVAERAKAFGIKVTFYDPYKDDGYDKALGIERVDSLIQLFSSSDIISLHAPSSNQNKHMVTNELLSLTKSNVILINTARGDLIKASDLLQWLLEKPDVLLGIDVFEFEPKIPNELLSNNRVIVTPHSAFYSNESMMELRKKSANAALKAIQNKTLKNRVN